MWCIACFRHQLISGMAYRFTDISALFEISVSVKVRTNKILAIGYRLWQNIGFKYRLHFSDFYPIYCKTLIYRQFLAYWLLVLVKFRTDKISVIGNQLWSNICNWLSAKFNPYAIPGWYYVLDALNIPSVCILVVPSYNCNCCMVFIILLNESIILSRLFLTYFVWWSHYLCIKMIFCSHPPTMYTNFSFLCL